MICLNRFQDRAFLFAFLVRILVPSTVIERWGRCGIHGFEGPGCEKAMIRRKSSRMVVCTTETVSRVATSMESLKWDEESKG